MAVRKKQQKNNNNNYKNNKTKQKQIMKIKTTKFELPEKETGKWPQIDSSSPPCLPSPAGSSVSQTKPEAGGKAAHLCSSNNLHPKGYVDQGKKEIQYILTSSYYYGNAYSKYSTKISHKVKALTRP